MMKFPKLPCHLLYLNYIQCMRPSHRTSKKTTSAGKPLLFVFVSIEGGASVHVRDHKTRSLSYTLHTKRLIVHI